MSKARWTATAHDAESVRPREIGFWDLIRRYMDCEYDMTWSGSPAPPRWRCPLPTCRRRPSRRQSGFRSSSHDDDPAGHDPRLPTFFFEAPSAFVPLLPVLLAIHI